MPGTILNVLHLKKPEYSNFMRYVFFIFRLHVCACTHIHTDIQKTQKLRKLNIYYPLGYEEFFESDSSSLLSELWSWDPIWFFEVLIEDKKIFDLIVRLLPITLKLMAEEGESFHSQSFCDAEGCSLRRRSLI